MHPLKSLLASRPVVPPAAAAPELPGRPPAAAPNPGGGLESEGSDGFVILAVQDPPSPEGRPGAIHFGPNLTLVERRRLVAELRQWEPVRI